jgi:hypothetical protein
MESTAGLDVSDKAEISCTYRDSKLKSSCAYQVDKALCCGLDGTVVKSRIVQPIVDGLVYLLDDPVFESRIVQPIVDRVTSLRAGRSGVRIPYSPTNCR